MFTKFDIGTTILAPKPSIVVVEKDYIPQFNSGGTAADACGGSCGSSIIKNWEIVFEVHFKGNGDLSSATTRYRNFAHYLDTICGTNTQSFQRQYCNEETLEYLIDHGYVKPINFDIIPDCCDNTTLSGEVHLFTTDMSTTPQLMQYDYHILVPTA